MRTRYPQKQAYLESATNMIDVLNFELICQKQEELGNFGTILVYWILIHENSEASEYNLYTAILYLPIYYTTLLPELDSQTLPLYIRNVHITRGFILEWTVQDSMIKYGTGKGLLRLFSRFQ